MVEFLNANFVNAWILIHDLPDLLEHDDAIVRAAAEICQAEHIYPVDSLVLTPYPDFVDGLWVEDVFAFGERPSFLERPASPYRGQGAPGYRAFLEAALGKWEER